jgi:VCBS repeat-containing protein
MKQLLLITLLVGSCCRLMAQQVIYVDQSNVNGAQNGQNWPNAYLELRDALHDPLVTRATAGSPVEIWVASGTYKPTAGTDRTVSFVVPSHIRLRGGFSGSEINIGQRLFSYGGIAEYVTVLSGDIGVPQPDGVTTNSTLASLPQIKFNYTAPGFLDNSENVILCSNATDVILDGVIVTGGYAKVATNVVNSAQINWMTVPATNQLGDTLLPLDHRIAGGGLAFINAPGWYENTNPSYAAFDLFVQNCIFIDNGAQGFGGGIAAREAYIGVGNSQFLQNISEYEGGAVWGQNILGNFEECYFSKNWSYRSGGAVHLETIPSLRSLNPYETESDFEADFSMTKTTVLGAAQSYQGTINASLDSMQSIIETNGFTKSSILQGLVASPTVATIAASDSTDLGIEILNFAEKTGATATANGIVTTEMGLTSMEDGYNIVGTALLVGTVIADISFLAGASTNTAAARGWNTFTTDFNLYATPEGLASVMANAIQSLIGDEEEAQETYDQNAEDIKIQDTGFYDVMPNTYFLFCQFETNQSDGFGGAIMATYDNVQVEDSRFDDNSAVINGGATAFMCSDLPVLVSDAFLGNQCTYGNSAIANCYRIQPHILNCTIMNNGSGSLKGCAMDNELGADATVGNCIFWGNTNASLSNGADLFTATSTTISKTAQTAYNQAGDAHYQWIGMCDVHYSSVQSLDTTPLGQDDIWAPIFESVYDITNYYYLEGLADSIGMLASSEVFELGQGTRPTLTQSGYGNNNKNPGISSDGVSPLPGSPMVNAGNINLVTYLGPALPIADDFDWSLTGLDLWGNPRFRGGNIDMGAVESTGTVPNYASFNPFTSAVAEFGGGPGDTDVLTNIYVNTNVSGGDGTGSSWANAMKQIPAILNLTPNGTLWIAAGTYRPPNVLTLQEGMSVYGGFQGNETNVAQSDPIHHPTIITGGGAMAGVMALDDTSYESVVGGLTFTGVTNNGVNGAAALSIPDGGTVQNCVFSGNAGIAANAYSASFSNCQFTANASGPTATSVLVLLGGSAESCLFSNNTGLAASATVFSSFSGCTFTGNSTNAASTYSALQTDTGNVLNCLFTNNIGPAVDTTAAEGYPVYVENSEFVNNTHGPALSSSASDLFVYSCKFNANSSSSSAAALSIEGNNALGTLYNSEFFRNAGASNAGAIYVSGPELDVYNCTIYSNTLSAAASPGGAGIRFDSDENCQIINTILVGNSLIGTSGVPLENQEFLGGTLSGGQFGSLNDFVLQSSIVQGLTELGYPYAAVDSFDANPQFVDPVHGNLELQYDSLAIDSGSSSAVPDWLLTTNDLAGNLRIVGASIDIGAYEYQSTPLPRATANLALVQTCDGLPIYNVEASFVPADTTNYFGAAAFQWQVDQLDGNGFVPLPTNGFYANVNTLNLQIVHPTPSMSGYFYRIVSTYGLPVDFLSTNVVLPVISPIVYVNQNVSGGTGDGTSWSNAMTDLSLALLNAPSCVQVWVAQGTYIPSGVQGPVGFAPGPKTQVYGGFVGTETNLSQRNWQANPVVLQASSTSAMAFNDSGIDEGTVVDGFYIQYSGTEAATEIDRGGPTIRNCVFSNSTGTAILMESPNTAAIVNCQFYNGSDTAFYNIEGHPTFQMCLFSNNISSGGPGAFDNEDGGSVLFTNCQFLNNSGATAGAVVNDENCTATILRCAFLGNSGGEAGAVATGLGSTTVIGTSLMASNSSTGFGAAIEYSGNKLSIAFCTIADNTSTLGGEGGAIDLYSSGWSVDSSIIWGNQAGAAGDAAQLYNQSSESPLHNVNFSIIQGILGDLNFGSNLPVDPLFVNESAENYQLQPDSPAIYHGDPAIGGYAVDLLGNRRPYVGNNPSIGCYEFQGLSPSTPENLVALPTNQTVCPLFSTSFNIVGITSAEATTLGLPPSIEYYQWQEFDGTNFTNITSSPQQLIVSSGTTNSLTLPAPGNFNGATFRIVINSGDYVTPTFQLTANPPGIIYVNGSAPSGGDGTTWATAFQTLSGALAVADSCSDIWVAQGTYAADNLPNGQPPQLRSGVQIFGGFNGTETNVTQRDYTNNVTRLVPGTAQYLMEAGYSGTADNTALLDGFHLSGAGTAIQIENAQPTIQNCTFETNGTSVFANNSAGLFLQNCTFHYNTQSPVTLYSVDNLQVLHCCFSSNSPSSGSVVLLSDAMNPVFSNCVFQSNSGAQLNLQNSTNGQVSYCRFASNSLGTYGAALYVSSGSTGVTNCQFCGNVGASPVMANDMGLAIERCIFTGNIAPTGGAIQAESGSLVLNDSLMANNQNTNGEGTINVDSTTVSLINDTVADNSGSYGGDGLYLFGGSLSVRNCIFWGNVDSLSYFTPEQDQIEIGGGVVPSISYNIIQGLSQLQDPARNNLSYDPLFVNEGGGNYQLATISPAIYAGNSSGISASDTDLLGRLRLHGGLGGNVDIGAYAATNLPGSPADLTWNFSSSTVCTGDGITFSVSNANPGYLVVTWLVNTGGGYVPVTNNAYYTIEALTNNSSLVGSTLTISSPDATLNGALYQFILTGAIVYTSAPITLTVSPRSVVYVDASASGTQDGSSWANAFTTLAPALNGAGACTAVWMAGGIYPQSQQLSIPPGVEIDGGFPSGGNLTNRNPASFPTYIQVASGQMPQALLALETAENPGQHTTFNGLNFRNGNNGVDCLAGSPVIENCAFNNFTNYAFLSDGASPYLTNCVFVSNNNGILGESTLQLSHCAFSNNIGQSIESIDGQLTVADSVFQNNTNGLGAAFYTSGGAINLVDSGGLVQRCIFSGNVASGGGAVSVDAQSALTLSDSLFAGNFATDEGGAMANQGALSVVNCSVANNFSEYEGGALVQYQGACQLDNSIFWGNNSLSLQITNTESAEIYVQAGEPGIVTLTNDILQFMHSFTGPNVSGVNPLFSNSLSGNFTLSSLSPAVNAGNNAFVASGDTDLTGAVRIQQGTVDLGAYESSASGGNNLKIQTLPQSASVYAGFSTNFTVTTTGNYDIQWQYSFGNGWTNLTDGQTLDGATISIAEGITNSILTISDATPALNGLQLQVTFIGTSFVSPPVTLTVLSVQAIYVDASAPANGDGLSWETAYNTMTQAVNAVVSYRNTIYVAQGTYAGGVTFYGQASLYGGFPSGGGTLAARNWQTYPTILSGGNANNSSVVLFDGQAGTITNSSIMDGFTVEGGSPGMDVFDASPTLSNLIVRSNSNSGIYVEGSPLIQNCAFQDNTSDQGGGVYIVGSPVFLECVIQGNSATDPQFGTGGGVAITSGNPQFLDVLITGNSSTQYGGAVYSDSPFLMVNSTVSGNYSAYAAGGICSSYGQGTIVNSILWKNADPLNSTEEAQASLLGQGALQFSYSTIQGLATFNGSGVVSKDPLFLNALDASPTPSTNGDFRLSPCSPLINAGNNSAASSISLDLDGQPRIIGTVDLGAYEFSGTPATALLVTTQPQSFVYSGSGTNNIFSVAATGDGLTYQWQEAPPGGAFVSLQDGASVTGSATPALTINQASGSVNNSLFRCEISSSEGCVAYSSEAVLTIFPTRYYVNASMSNDLGNGLSWSTAFQTLHHAAQSPVDPSGTQIWVAAGTYQPISFTSGDLFYGGFAGTETVLSQRNSAVNPTIIQATTNVPLASLNNPGNQVIIGCYSNYIVEPNQTAPVFYPITLGRIDGFVLRNGGTALNVQGNTSGMTLANCLVTNCDLGVWANQGSSVQITNCLFENGNIGFLDNSGNSIVTNSTFFGNGTGIELIDAVATVGGSTFTSNGEGIYASSEQLVSGLTLNDSTFNANNQGLQLTGDINIGFSAQRCSFRGNGFTGVDPYGEFFGGAVFIDLQVDYAPFDDCLFSGNYCPYLGGAVYNSGVNTVFQNCTFSGNREMAIYNDDSSYAGLSFYNCIAWGNAAVNSTEPEWWQSLEFGSFNTSWDAQICARGGNDGNNIVQDENAPSPYIPNYSGSASVSIDPGFVSPIDPNSAPTTNGDFHLTACSSIIGLGSVAQVGPSATDLDGQPRLYAGTVTPGAYQPASAPLTFVTQPTNFPGIQNESVAFAATVMNTNDVTYNWQVSVAGGAFNDLANAAPYSGVTTTQLVFAASAAENGNVYQLRASYPSGCSIYSQPASFTLYSPTVSAAGPSGNGTLLPTATSFGFSIPGGANPASINDQSIAVYGMESGRLSFSNGTLSGFTISGSTVQLTPAHPLHAGEQVFVTVNSSLQSTNGFAATPTTWEFVNSVNSWDGAFSNAQTVAMPGNPTANLVQAGDLNGDGSIDLFVSTTTGCRVLTNGGTGVFTDSGQVIGTDAATKIILGNVRGNGLLDAVLLRDGAIEIWTNSDTGMFNMAAEYSSVPVIDMALGDLNNDGLMDLFILTADDNRVWWNEGSGNFVDSGDRLAATNGVSVALGDFNEDGNLDAYVVHSDATPGQLWLNEGGQFVAGTNAGLPSVSSGYQRVIAAEMVGDGHLDLVAVANGAAQVWQGKGNGSFSSYFQAGTVNPNAVAVGDINGNVVLDGGQIGDLIVARAGGALSPYVVYPGVAVGLQSLGDQSAFANATATTLADLNGDGALDLALISPSGQLQIAFYQPVELYGNENTYPYGNYTDALPIDEEYLAELFTQDYPNDINGLAAMIMVSAPTNGYLMINSEIVSPGDTINFSQFYWEGIFPNVTYVGYTGTYGLDSFTWQGIDGASPDGQTSPPKPTIFKFNISIAQIVAVNAQNDYASVSQGGSVSVLTNGATSVLANDQNSGGDTLTAVLTASPAHGSVQLNSDGTFTYTHDGSETHSDSFGYQAVDSLATKSGSATVYITITNVNNTPSAINLAQTTVYEGQAPGATVGQLSSVDPDPEAGGFVYTLVSGAGDTDNASFSINGSTLLTAASLGSDDGATRSIRVRSTDVEGAFLEEVLTINLTTVPVANPQSFSGVENFENVFVNLSGSGGAGHLQYIVVTSPTNGVLTGTAPNLIYTANFQFFGTDGFTYQVTDGVVTSAVASVTITIAPIDEAPAVQSTNLTVLENTPLSFTLTATPYIATNGLQFTIVRFPQSGTLTGTSPNFVYFPATNHFGSDAFTFDATDTTLNQTSLPVTVFINVVPLNTPPVAYAQTVQDTENEDVFFQINAQDIDSSLMTYSVVTPPQHGQLFSGFLNIPQSVGPVYVEYLPTNGFTGTDTFAFVASNGTTNSAPATVTIIVSPPVLPIANSQTVNTTQGQPVNITLTGNDPLGQPLFYQLTGNEAGGLTGTPPNLTYTSPDTNFYGSVTFGFITLAGNRDSAVATVTVNVQRIIQPPIAVSAVYTNYGNTFQLQMQATDPQGLPLTYQLISGPTNGTLVATNLPQFTYTPTLNSFGVDSLTFTASDGLATSAVATIVFDDIEYSHAPTVQNLLTNAFLGVPFTFSAMMLASDDNDDPLTLVGIVPTANAIVTYTNGLVTYTPTNLLSGNDSFGIIFSNRFQTATSFVYVTPMPRQLLVGFPTSSPQGIPYVFSAGLLDSFDTLPNAVAFANSFGPSLEWTINLWQPIQLSNAQTNSADGSLSALSITGNIRIVRLPLAYGVGAPTSNFSLSIATSTIPLPPFRLFQVAPGARLRLENAVVFGGTGLQGGAIFNQGRVELFETVLTSNTATAFGGPSLGLGGGIFNSNGAVAMTNSFLTNNTADMAGGIYQIGNGAAATMTASNSVIIANTSPEDYYSTATNGGTSAITSTLLTVGQPSAPWFSPLAASYTIAQNLPLSFPVEFNPEQFQFMITPSAPWNDGSQLEVTGSGAHRQLVLSQPELNNQAPENISLSLTNGQVSYTENFTLAVNSSFQNPPVANEDLAAVNPLGSVSIPVLANDVNRNGPQSQLTLVSVSSPEFGTATIDGTNIVYVNAANDTYSDTFTYVVSDGSLTSTGTVVVTLVALEGSGYVYSTADSGAGSLRSTIESVGQNYVAGGWAITLLDYGSSLFDLTTADDTVDGPSAFVIYQDVVIDGTELPGATLQIDPNAPPMRFFHIMPGASLTLSNLTLIGGIANPSDYGAGSGGAIYNEGSLDLENVTIFNCQANGDTNYPGLGGAIYSVGSVIMNGSVLTNNTAGVGGGIYQLADGVAASANITNSLISNPESGYDTAAAIAHSGTASFAVVDSIILNPQAPWIGQMSDMYIFGTNSAPVDVGQGANTAVLTATSGNPLVVPTANLSISGSKSFRQLNVIPVNNGQANVFVQAAVGGVSFGRGITVNVYDSGIMNPVTPDYSLTVYDGQAITFPIPTNDYDLGGASLDLVSVSSASDGTVTITNNQILYANANDGAESDYFTYVVTNNFGGSSTGRIFVTVVLPEINVTSTSQYGAGSLGNALNSAQATPLAPGQFWTITIDPSLAGQMAICNIAYGQSSDYTAYIITNGNISIDASAAPGFTLGVIDSYYNEPMRLFKVEPGTSLELLDFAITGGTAYGGPFPIGYGGVVLNEGTFTAQNMVFYDNTADGDGGAIANYDGVMSLTSNLFSNNVASETANILNVSDGIPAVLTLQNNILTNNLGLIDLDAQASGAGISQIISYKTNVIMTQNAPAISVIPDQVASGVIQVPFSFNFSSMNPVLTASSSDPTILPNSGLAVSTNGNNGELTITPAGHAGSVNVFVQLTDSNLVYSEVFQVALVGTPLPASETFTTMATQPLTFNVLAGYVGLSVVSYNSNCLLGQLAQDTNGTFTYNPDGRFASLATGQTATNKFTCLVTNASDPGAAAKFTISIIVTGVNSAPTTRNIVALRQPGQPVQIPIATIMAAVNDIDDPTFFFDSFDTNSANGAVITETNNALLYTPVPGNNQSDTFHFTVYDTHELTAAGTVFVIIAPTNWTILNSGGVATSNVFPVVNFGSGESVVKDGQDIVIQFIGAPNQAYLVQTSTDLRTWTTVATSTTDSNGVLIVRDLAPADQDEFYRIILP